MTLISRQPLRKEIRHHLIDRLYEGDLEPGSQIREADLTEELGVSRTPLREALLQLEFEGFLTSTPGKGFSVAPLDEREMSELFTVGRALETLSLRLAGGIDRERLETLRELNDERKGYLDRPERMVETDDEWHRTLAAACDNQQLLSLLALVRKRLYRYILAFAGHETHVKDAIRDHEMIQDALARDDLEEAVSHLDRHWTSFRETMIELMRAEAA